MDSVTVARTRGTDDVRAVAVATELLAEYPSRPIIEVIRAVIRAQRLLREAGARQGPPELLAARTRDVLRDSPVRSAALLNHVRTKGRQS